MIVIVGFIILLLLHIQENSDAIFESEIFYILVNIVTVAVILFRIYSFFSKLIKRAKIEIDKSSQNIEQINFEELEYVEDLNISDNNLKELDLSPSANLVKLKCENNKLSELKLPITIEDLDCSNNLLQKLDFSKIENLKTLICSDNNLEDLYPIPQKLAHLDCKNNKIKEIFLDERFDYCLKFIDCSNNKIEKLNLKNAVSLKSLLCVGNQLRSLDVHLNRELENLDCRDNINLEVVYVNQDQMDNKVKNWEKSENTIFKVYTYN